MENQTDNEPSDFVKNEVLKLERASFVVQIIFIVVGYAGITLLLNAIRATVSLWFVWVLIIIQFTLYFLIFIRSYQRSKVCGLNQNIGVIIFTVLAILGRVNNWELLIIPLLAIVMLIISTRNKKISNEMWSSLMRNRSTEDKSSEVLGE